MKGLTITVYIGTWLIKERGESQMDWKDLLEQLGEDPEQVKHRQKLKQNLEEIRLRLSDISETVKDAEIVEAIQIRFKLVSGSDFLDEAAWLMDALSFTSAPIASNMIQEAWLDFQNTHDLPYLSLDDYPILEGMANWYLEHRRDSRRDEMAMTLRSLALYEYLLVQVRGHESDSDYEGLLSEIGPRVVDLYCGLHMYDRAKFYVQLLGIEYKSDRLSEEDYLEVMKTYELLLIKERGEATTTVEKELHKINHLCWDTISARDRRLNVIEQEKVDLLDKLARGANPAFFVEVTKRLSDEFGLVWEKLHAETRRFIEIADMFTQEPFVNSWPGGGATCAYLALKSELLHRFSPCLRGALSEALKKVSGDPIKLLLTFGNDKRKLLTQEERKAIKLAVRLGFGDRFELTARVRSVIELLKTHRDHAQHPEGGHAYRIEDFAIFHQKIWASGWLRVFLACDF